MYIFSIVHTSATYRYDYNQCNPQGGGGVLEFGIVNVGYFVCFLNSFDLRDNLVFLALVVGYKKGKTNKCNK